MVGHFTKRNATGKPRNTKINPMKKEPLLLEEWDSSDIITTNEPSAIHASIRPRAFTVTSTEQNRKLQSVADLEVAHAREQTSGEWLSHHGLEASRLLLKDLLEKGTPLGGATFQEDLDCTLNLKMVEEDVREFELKIHCFVTKLQQRIQWLLSDSRKVFGLIKGVNPCLLVDASDINMCFGRADYLREALQQLLNEQLAHKCKLQLISFNQNIRWAWNRPEALNNLLKPEAHKWINCLTPSSGCNALDAFKVCFKQKPVDSIVLVLGNSPDQNPQLIIDYVKEQLSGRNVFMHTVSFNCKLLETQQFLQELANECGGRYHCFSAENEEDAMQSTDIMLLKEEMQRAFGILLRLNELKEGGVVDNTMITYKKVHQELVDSHFHEVQSEEVKRHFKEYQQISIENACSQIRTSSQWLKTHGLKAKGLTLYQVMAPNAYSYVNSYVSSLNKEVNSRIHHQSMVQMEWHDGSVKNVHVDPVILFSYQHHLQTALCAYERRVQWLNDNSRRCFGTIIHNKVLLLIDLSTDTQFGLGELQLSLKCLLEQQLNGKDSFNIICLGDELHVFHQTMVKPTKENLAAAWRWFSRLTCSGTRKCLKGFRHIFENNEGEDNCVHEVDGIYFIVTGPPDEPKDVLNAYICEQLCGTEVSVNCTLFQSVTQNEFDAGPSYFDVEETSLYLRTIAHQNNGRFHWIDSQMVVESDDIRLIHEEMNKANNYLTKTEMLFKKLRAKRHDLAKAKHEDTEEKRKEKSKRKTITRPRSCRNKDITTPKHTALSLARLGFSRPKSAHVSSSVASHVTSEKKKAVSVKLYQNNTPSTPWRPSTAYAKTLIPSVPDPVPGKTFDDVSAHVEHERNEPIKQVFYTEIGNNTGCVLRETRHTISASQAMDVVDSKASSPIREELLSTKDWLKKYGLSNINARLFSSPNKGNPLSNHSVDHPTISLKELRSYEQQIERTMRRCTKRMKWLLKGSHLLLGTILEDHVVLVIDTSGSMAHHMKQLKEKFVTVVWEQLHKHKKHFTLIAFSNHVTLWKDELVEGTRANCEEAIAWIRDLRCEGGTATLDALECAFAFSDVSGVYLLSDGKPDSSTTMVLREASNMNTNRDVHIHSISFNCDDGEANTFLKMLAWQSNGRFHMFKTKGGNEMNMINDEMFEPDDAEDEHTQHQRASESHGLTLFEGDDLKLLLKEINSAKKYFHHVKSYMSSLEDSSWMKKKRSAATNQLVKSQTTAAK